MCDLELVRDTHIPILCMSSYKMHLLDRVTHRMSSVSHFICVPLLVLFTIFVYYFLQRKLLAVYIHHDKSIFSNVFCSQILCSESVVSFLSQNFVTWAWDVTEDSNKARWVHDFLPVSRFLSKRPEKQYQVLGTLTYLISHADVIQAWKMKALSWWSVHCWRKFVMLWFAYQRNHCPISIDYDFGSQY